MLKHLEPSSRLAEKVLYAMFSKRDIEIFQILAKMSHLSIIRFIHAIDGRITRS